MLLSSIAALASVAFSPAFAGEKAAPAGVSSPVYEALKKPCAKDLAKRCPGQTGHQAVACLDKNKPSLAKSCRDAMTPLLLQKAKSDQARGADNPCAPVFAKVCPDAKPGVALYKCLKAHDAELPPQCRVTGKTAR